MKLKPGSKHVLGKTRRKKIHSISRNQKILIRAARGTLTGDDALNLVLGDINPREFAATVIAKARRLL